MTTAEAIARTENEIQYCEANLEEAVAEYKRKIASYTAFEIAEGMADGLQRQIKELTAEIRTKKQFVEMLKAIR